MSMEPATRMVAVDWSGAVSGAESKIWLAEANGVGSLARLECGRSRSQLIDHVVEMAEQDPRFVLGLDFAFSFPQWYLANQGLTSAYQLWSLAALRSEEWLSECPRPFWGRHGVKKWDIVDEYRRTEREVPAVTGIRPKSVFQVYGAGAVGTGSLRGMPFLKRLHDAGFSIWPFDEPRWPMVVEIYPRLLTGPIRKSNPNQRISYLSRTEGRFSAEFLFKAASCDDAFDAAISALAMVGEWEGFGGLGKAEDEVGQMEGEIWYPGQGERRPDSNAAVEREGGAPV